MLTDSTYLIDFQTNLWRGCLACQVLNAWYDADRTVTQGVNHAAAHQTVGWRQQRINGRLARVMVLLLPRVVHVADTRQIPVLYLWPPQASAVAVAARQLASGPSRYHFSTAPLQLRDTGMTT